MLLFNKHYLKNRYNFKIVKSYSKFTVLQFTQKLMVGFLFLFIYYYYFFLTKEILWCQSYKQSNTDFGQNQVRCVLPRWKWYPPVTLAQNSKTLFSFLHFGGRNGHSPIFEGHPKSHFPRRTGKWNSKNSNYGLRIRLPTRQRSIRWTALHAKTN